MGTAAGVVAAIGVYFEAGGETIAAGLAAMFGEIYTEAGTLRTLHCDHPVFVIGGGDVYVVGPHVYTCDADNPAAKFGSLIRFVGAVDGIGVGDGAGIVYTE